MASNFFEQQDLARKRSGRLIFLMAAAIVGIVLVTYPVIAGTLYFLANMGESETTHRNATAQPQPGIGFWDPLLFAAVTIGTLLIVSLSSLYKVSSLKAGGGGSVARSLGGLPIDPNSSDPDERKLLNVVEEMAIASGTPVPPVYLLDNERGINAFAAGYKPDDAVLGVTRGAIQQLSRDELQGVIAHEFSHILNGDMRLNIRLMGMIFGILVLGVIGRVALRTAFYSSAGRKKDGKAVIVIAIVGLLLVLLGFIGMVFGKLIKAAVSRQREFLADASAVQFTRNPDGIGGALKRLGGRSSEIGNPHAEEAAHMFFGPAVNNWIGSMATHPPLPQRILRIDPNWDGVFPEPKREERVQHQYGPQRKGGQSQGIPGMPNIPGVPGADGGAVPGGMLGAVITGAVIADAAGPGGTTSGGGSGGGSALDSVGTLDDAHIAYARQLIAGIPGPLREAARHPVGSRAVVFVVLLDRKDAAVRDKQLAHLGENADPAVAELTRQLASSANDLQREARLSLVDLCLPALQRMSPEQYAIFRGNVDSLIEADERVDLFEWTLRRLLTRHIEAHLFRPTDPRVHYYALKPVAEHCAVLLSTLARVGSRDEDEMQAAFAAGAEAVKLDGITLVDREGCRLSAVGRGFDELAKLSPREKRTLLHGCAAVIAADGQITVSEGELMRCVADSLDCPMPPLLPGQKLT